MMKFDNHSRQNLLGGLSLKCFHQKPSFEKPFQIAEIVI